MKMNKSLHAVITILVFLTANQKVVAQTIITGIVRDAVSQKPLAFVSVYFTGRKGTVTREDGTYYLSTINPQLTTVEFSYGGYKTTSKTVLPGKTQELNINMELPVMKEVVIQAKRGKYKNKDNPAVELIRKVIEHKNSNRITAYPYVQYEQYEKMMLSLTKKPEKLAKSKLLKNYQFVLDNQDTAKIAGKSLFPIYMQEKLSQKYYRNKPEKEKIYILGEKKVDFGEFVDNNGIITYLNRLYGDIDVYENNISILTNQFLSPIADMAPQFYRFYIIDTVTENGLQLVKLNFTPRNSNDLIFRGTMFITLDGNYAVQKINMTISKNANLNWTQQLRIAQDFEKGADGRYHVIMSNMLAEFALSKNASGSLMGERTVTFKNFITNKPAADSIYEGRAEVIAYMPDKLTDSFWVASRHKPLSAAEAKVYANIDSLSHMKSFQRTMDYVTLALAGYKQAGPFEVGPVSTFYSFNPVEGFRLRFGGRSTPRFSKNIFLENYLAYGFKDEKFKYYLAAAYSFNHKSIYSYPLNYLRFSYQYDTKIPGQELQFVAEDNFLLSFKRGDNNKWLYNSIFKAEYVREFGKNLSYSLGFKNWKQTAAGSIVYEKAGSRDNVIIPDITTTELSAEIRWAPNEQFYQGKVYRVPIFNKYPIFKLRYTAGIKGLVNGEYNFHALNLNIFKRVYLSQLGYADVVAEGGYIFGQLPYPLLNIHRANQTYSYQLNSYNLMNFLEFVSDHYASVNMDYYFNGFIFNKIPLLKKLKLREVVSGKILYGGIRDENNPDKNNAVFKFPTDEATNNQTTFSLNQKPYIEVSAGIANIFKLVRIDLVKRLTYSENPNVSQWGIRSRLKFDF
jgi:Family of unknown function (DUF5686)/CarboxypepD_reg-like domain